MKFAVFNAGLFALLAVWSAATSSWVAPGFMAIALAQVLMLLLAAGKVPEDRVMDVLVGRLALWFLGLAYIAAALVGPPDTRGFWLVFGVVVTVVGPIVVLARTAFRKGSASRS